MPQLPLSSLLVASIIAGTLSFGVLMTTLTGTSAAMYLNPITPTAALHERFTVDIVVTSTTPVNAFKGLMHFDAAKLRIERIDYNTSIANLWAEEPWYENGDGTLSFIGGTTKAGGFSGEGSLVTVTFVGTGAGDALLGLDNVAILKHDGLGTNADLETPIDVLFTVTDDTNPAHIPTPSPATENVTILAAGKSTDLNGDGKQSLTDISIFMRYLTSQNLKADFNGDSIVSTKDLSIILLQ